MSITESFHEYKGYTIRLRAATFDGFKYSIIRKIPHDKSPNGVKNLYLRQQAFSFISADKLLAKAINYINNFADRLQANEKRLIAKMNEKTLQS